jgi:mycothiol system anti-sigma-R factor
MDCNGVKRVLFLYFDNEMGEAVQVDLQHHISVCPVCAKEYHAVRKTVALVRRRCSRVRAPESLRQRILSTLRHR